MIRRNFLVSATLGLAGGGLGRGAAAAEASPAATPGEAGKALIGPDEAIDAARFHVDRRLLGTRFGTISYLDRGTGPAALFIHGFPLNGFQWRGAIDRLSPLRRCLAPDLLGMGYTDPRPGQSLGPHAQVEMLLDFLDELGVGEIDLVGNDSGGTVAQLLAARAPGRVRTLLLTNCDTEIDNPPPALATVIALAREGDYPDAWLVPWFHDKELARRKELSDGYSRAGFPSDAALEVYLGPLIATPRRKALTNEFTLALEPNVLRAEHERLKRFPGEVRIVWGTADGLFARDSPAFLDGLFPNSRGIRALTGARFFFPEEYPDLIAEEARRLWLPS
ncbi:MAG: alpha/beta hydrolase [Sphingomonas sp.]|uniref:alpha/beta fold hydrolase n=1 Tax=Sphingomonas sp. TaxID=28214 RepID=UPI001B2E49B1|nr:alpha/beta hydrolase [Sphingomonas sp.]MBO9621566.1 alpha/beta hydrolase [Sphingomonas sp.]